jgi:hypothetical protein
LSIRTDAVNNPSIDTSYLNQPVIEWTETTHFICPNRTLSAKPFYNLVIKDNENNQTIQNVSVPNSCVISYDNKTALMRKLTFNKTGQITSHCPKKTVNLVSGGKRPTSLRPCVVYSVHVFRSEKDKNPMWAVIYKNSFVIQTLEKEGKN